jgi:hypothetical protein
MNVAINTNLNQTINLGLNYTLVNDMMVEPSTNVTTANFAILPSIKITNSTGA